ncbi:MAG: OmpA family protein [Proteobacteria bacterium]|nr:OmpA family protein [Pseudomonadota bacterium]
MYQTEKIKGFELLVDLSKSTGIFFLGKQLWEDEIQLLRKLNATIPGLDYQAALRTFGYRTEFNTAQETKLLWGPMKYDRAALGPVMGGIEATQSLTPLGYGIAASDAELAKMPGRKALLIFSDFEWSPHFGDPMGAAKALNEKYGADLAIYTIFFGEPTASFKLAEDLAKMTGGKTYKASDLLKDQASLDAMVMEIFYGQSYRLDSDCDGVYDEDDKCPDTPRIFKVNAVGCPLPLTVRLEIEFDTDKSDIRPQYHDRMTQVAQYLVNNPSTQAVIEGHTDSVATPEYNLKLSQRRADAVLDYFADKFKIDKDRLRAVGYGETRPIASNDTEDGRQKNRRVMVVISGGYKKK